MTPIYFLRDPELFKQIAIKEFDSFEDHRFIIEPEMDSLMGNTLFLMRGQKWREMRTTLSPAFTGSKMRLMFDLVSECAIQSCNAIDVKKIDKNIDESIEMRDFYSRYTNDVIASCAFGLKINSFNDRNNEFFETGKKLQDLASLKSFFKIFLLKSAPWLTKLLKIQFIDSDVRKVFSKLVLDNIETRRANKLIRPDLIDLLMRTKRKGLFSGDKNEHTTKHIWTDDEIISQAFVFFLAGFDTSMWLLVAFSYELALNPTIQQNLIEEIDATCKSVGGEEITYQNLSQMKYLDMVLNEVLRLHSPAVFVDRLCSKDFLLSDGENVKVQFQKGNVIWVPIYCFHHNSDYFPNPEQFDPERFNDENKKNINPAHFIPFGTGPRACIGNRFAIMEAKVMIFYLLKHFNLNVSSKTEIPMIVRSSPFGLTPKNGLHLSLKKR